MKKITEKPRTRKFHHLLITIATIFLGAIFLGNSYFEFFHPKASQIKLGVSFSKNYSQLLGLDWQQTYLDILENLQVKNLRIFSYWTEIEPQNNQYNFKDLDFMVDQAQRNNAQILLVVGAKQPRWPECFIPEWAKKLSLEQRQQQTLEFIEQVVKRYQDRPNIWGWQVENEPLLNYGAFCDPVNPDFLTQEVEFVRSLDPNRKIVVSDSGELRFWQIPMSLSDIFGTTMYKTVHNPMFGYYYWPLPPAFYNLKSQLIRKIFSPMNEKTIIIELQAEPWLEAEVPKVPIQRQQELFTLEQLTNNIDFAKRTGFDEIYLWGVEWWYYMAKNGHPQYLEKINTYFP